MKVRASAFFAFAFLLLGSVAITAEATQKQLQDKYSAILKEEGYAPKIDEDGDVQFKYEGKTYYILINEEDPTFFELIYPSFWKIESEEERSRAYIASSYATMDTKVAKIFPTETNTTATIEMFVSDPGDIQQHLDRILRALRTAVEKYKGKMNE
jgi:hypothetical protein